MKIIKINSSFVNDDEYIMCTTTNDEITVVVSDSISKKDFKRDFKIFCKNNSELDMRTGLDLFFKKFPKYKGKVCR